MCMHVSVEFANAGAKSDAHRILMIGRGSERPEAGQYRFESRGSQNVNQRYRKRIWSARAAAIVDARRQCSCAAISRFSLGRAK